MQSPTRVPSRMRQRNRSKRYATDLNEEAFWLYDRALAAASSGIAIADATQSDYPIVYCNPAFEKLTGYSRTEILGRKCCFLPDPDTQDAACHEVQGTLADRPFCQGIPKTPNGRDGFRLPDALAADRDLFNALATGDRDTYQVEKRFLRKDASIRWGRLSASAIRNSQGKPQFILTMVEDITERKQAEAALAQNEAKWRSLIQQSSDIITILDTKATIIYESPSVKSILGYTPEELVGRSAFDFVHPDDCPRLIACFKALVTNPESCLPIEFRFQRADGSWGFLEASGTNLLHDPAVGAIVVNSRDVTARKQAEYRLSKINECFLGFSTDAIENIHHLTTLAGELLGGICALYNRLENGLLRWVGNWQSPADVSPVDLPEGHICYEAIRRSAIDAVVLTDLQNTIYAETDPCVKRYNLQTYLGHAVRVGDTCLGSLCIVYTEPVVPSEADRKLIGIIAVAIGVEEQRAAAAASERRKAQELRKALNDLQQTQMQLIQTEKMSSLGQMIAGVAHEINNPISFVTGNLGYINDYIKELLTVVQLYQECYPNPDPEIQKQLNATDLDFVMEDLPKLLESMKVGTDRIVEILQTLRNFSRIDGTKMREADLHEGLNSTLLILKNRLKAQRHRPAIQVIKEYGDLPLVECYPGQLNQVFMNLLANAIDALEEEAGDGKGSQAGTQLQPPKITIRTETLESDRVKIHIQDNGTGIPKEIIAKLFDPFFTTKPIGKGTGLGLSISHQIITEKHRGKLHCLSEPGQGTEFIIEIPVKQTVS